MLDALPDAALLAVDPFLAWADLDEDSDVDAAARAATARLLGYRPRVQLSFMPSAEAARWVPDGHLDLVYLDGDHEYPFFCSPEK